MLTSLISAKVVVVFATAGGLSAGGAALAGVMPDASHHPAAHAVDDPSTDPTTTPTHGPDPTGPAAHGLCNAWAHNTVHGQGATHGQAFLALAATAGGAEGVVTYCATVTAPTSDPTEGTESDSESSGKPTSHPTHPAHPSHSNHPTGRPSTHPTPPSHEPASTHGHRGH